MPKLSQSNLSIIDKLLNLLQQQGISLILSICSSCGEWLGSKDGNGVCGISHGYCGKCADKLRLEWRGKNN